MIFLKQESERESERTEQLVFIECFFFIHFPMNFTPDPLPLPNRVHLHHDPIRQNSEPFSLLFLSLYSYSYVHILAYEQPKKYYIHLLFFWMVSFARMCIGNGRIIHDKRWIDNEKKEQRLAARPRESCKKKKHSDFDHFSQTLWATNSISSFTFDTVCFLGFFISFVSGLGLWGAHFSNKQSYLN